MAKIKASRGKPKTAAPQRGVGCIVLLVLGMVLVMLFLIYVMGHANQS
jgi:hypothetical protein